MTAREAMPERETIVIVGPGRAGIALGRLWQAKGHRISGIAGGSAESVAAARGVVGDAVPVIPHAAALGKASLVLIAVPDDRLEEAVGQIAAGGAANRETLVVHVSGAHGLDALARLAGTGARTAACHPLHAFPTRDPGPRDLGGALCAIESAAEDRLRLFGLSKEIGGTPFALAAKDRALYHAAAAAAGNGVLALVDLGLRAFEEAGVPRGVGLRALVDLTKGALDNAAALGPAAALTGPVVRGDREVIIRHLAALDVFSPVDERFYWAVVRALIRLASQRPDGWKARQVASASDELRGAAEAAGADG
jgi:predicted short-subunit dehydrogenase-like oxidoreductase (DUF2520 family)